MYYKLTDRHVAKLIAARKLAKQARDIERKTVKNEKRMSEAAFENALDRSERIDEQSQAMIAAVLRDLVKL